MNMENNSDIEIYEVGKPSWEYLEETVSPDYLGYTNRETVNHQKVRLFAAEIDYDFVGYAFFVPKQGTNDTYVLLSILVISEERFHGVARAMLDQAVQVLKQDGIKNLEAIYSEDDAENAVPFLTSCGFTHTGKLQVLTFTTDQLRESPIHNSTDSSGDIKKKTGELTGEEARAILKSSGVNIKGMDPELSAVLMDEERYCGYAALSHTENELCMESMDAVSGQDSNRKLIEIWKYAVDRLLQEAEENEISEVNFRFDGYTNASEKVIGKPARISSLPIYSMNL